MADPSDAGGPLRVVPAIVTLCGLLLAVAGALAPSKGPAAGLLTPVWVPIPDWLTIVTLAALTAAGAIFIAVVQPWRRTRRRNNDPRRAAQARPLSPLMATLVSLLGLLPVLLFVAAFVFLQESGGLAILNNLGSLGNLLPKPPVGPAQPASPTTTGLIGLVMVLVAAGSLGSAIYLMRLTYHRSPASGPARRHSAVAAAVEDSLEDLQHVIDARVAIIKIYGNFERALATAAVPRRPWQTPIEFMRVVLHSLHLPAKPVTELTRLFELARFSRHPLGSDERRTALDSLVEIRTTLAAAE